MYTVKNSKLLKVIQGLFEKRVSAFGLRRLYLFQRQKITKNAEYNCLSGTAKTNL